MNRNTRILTPLFLALVLGGCSVTDNPADFDGVLVIRCIKGKADILDSAPGGAEINTVQIFRKGDVGVVRMGVCEGQGLLMSNPPSTSTSIIKPEESL